MRAALLIARKDFLQSVRNRSFLVLGVLAPLAIMTVMDLTMGDVLSGSFNPVIQIVDGSGGSDELAEGLRDAGFRNVELVASAAAARQAVDENEADAAIIFPPELDRALTDPTRAVDIEVVTTPDSELSATISRSIAESSAARIRTVRASAAVVARTGPEAVAGLAPGESAITVANTDAGTRVLADSTYFAVAMATFFVFFTAQAGITTLHQERRQATLARMLVAPSARWAPLVGKSLASVVTGLTALGVLWLLSTVLLGADWGPPLGVIMIGVASMVAAVGLGAMATSFTTTSEAADSVSSIVTTAFAFFGGAFVQIPTTGALATLSRLSPFRWIMEGIGQNAGVGTLGDVAFSATVLAAFGLIPAAIAFSRRNVILGGSR